MVKEFVFENWSTFGEVMRKSSHKYRVLFLTHGVYINVYVITSLYAVTKE